MSISGLLCCGSLFDFIALLLPIHQSTPCGTIPLTYFQRFLFPGWTLANRAQKPCHLSSNCLLAPNLTALQRQGWQPPELRFCLTSWLPCSTLPIKGTRGRLKGWRSRKRLAPSSLFQVGFLSNCISCEQRPSRASSSQQSFGQKWNPSFHFTPTLAARVLSPRRDTGSSSLPLPPHIPEFLF